MLHEVICPEADRGKMDRFAVAVNVDGKLVEYPELLAGVGHSLIAIQRDLFVCWCGAMFSAQDAEFGEVV